MAFLSEVRSEQRASAGRNEIQSAEDRGFIDAKEAATFLGIPLRSLHQYVQQGLLPSYKLGRHRLFRRQELLNVLQATNKATREEILR
ncbi:MAG: helix-turn-helix domain-containing protein [Verrucomicrobia bacterium]|nr:helix-turn-helix domain-containing protein [Verrucomicrobiota bacterium]